MRATACTACFDLAMWCLKDGALVLFEGCCCTSSPVTLLRLQSLKRERNEVQQVEEGVECGVLLEEFGGFEAGDVLECVGTQAAKASSAEILAAAPGQM